MPRSASKTQKQSGIPCTCEHFMVVNPDKTISTLMKHSSGSTVSIELCDPHSGALVKQGESVRVMIMGVHELPRSTSNAGIVTEVSGLLLASGQLFTLRHYRDYHMAILQQVA